MSHLELQTQEEFRHLKENNEWLLLDFWANWCAPCKTMAPIFERVVEQKQDILAAAKVNVDHQQELARDFKIRGIPTLVLLRNGETVEQKVGAHTERELRDWLDTFISNDNKQ